MAEVISQPRPAVPDQGSASRADDRRWWGRWPALRLDLLRTAVPVLGLALGVRLAFVLLGPRYRPVLDGAEFQALAHSLLDGHGYAFGSYLTAFRPPGYAFFLAAVTGGLRTLGGTAAAEVQTVRVTQAVLGVVQVGLLVAVARPVWGVRTAWVAGVLAAVYVPFLEVGESFVSEALAVPLLLATILCVQRSLAAGRPGDRQANLGWVVAAGVLLGMLTLTRPNLGLLAVPLGLALRHRGPGPRRRRWRAPAVLLLAAALTAAPWTIRNAIEFHTLIPVSTDGGETLAGTYNDAARHDRRNPAAWRVPRGLPPYAAIFAAPGRNSEAHRDQLLVSAALGYAAAHPLYVAQVAGNNALRLAELTGAARWRFTAATIGVDAQTADTGVVCFWLIAALAVVGVLRGGARAPRWLWACPLITVLGTLPLTMETPRFRSAIDPFLLLLAAAGLVGVGPGLSRWQRGGLAHLRAHGRRRDTVGP